MFAGATQYSEGQIRPMGRPSGSGYDVWCMTGALEVLRRREYVKWLIDNPNGNYMVNFANGAAARIKIGNSLWEFMAEITKKYAVEVFPLSLRAKYVPWTGEPNSLSDFDAILIKNKPL